MQKLTFKAENWVRDEVEVTVNDDGTFIIQGDKFWLGEPRVSKSEEADMEWESIDVYSEAHSSTVIWTVTRDLRPDRWSDSLYHIIEGDSERTGKTAIEAVAKMVAWTM